MAFNEGKNNQDEKISIDKIAGVLKETIVDQNE
jgi:hypothetical protein